MGLKILILTVSAILASSAFAKTKGQRSPAQDPPRFAPPRPPSLDGDFEDPMEDEMENGDAPSRAQMQPPAPPPQAPANDFRPPSSMSGGGNGMNSSKLKFQVAEGEFYEKGKKRGRSPNEKRQPQGR